MRKPILNCTISRDPRPLALGLLPACGLFRTRLVSGGPVHVHSSICASCGPACRLHDPVPTFPIAGPPKPERLDTTELE